MGVVKTGNVTHDAAVYKAETVRQAAAVPTATPATVKAADVTFFQTAAASGAANNCSPSVFLFALQALGRGLYG